MSKRMILGGVAGGVAVYIWSVLSHMVLGLGDTGIKQIANEESVLAAMRDNIQESGFYFFPGVAQAPGMSKEEQQQAMQAWQAKYTAGPIGILIYHPQGQQPLLPRQLLLELLSDITAALIAAFLLAQASGKLIRFGNRVLFVTLLGLFSSLVVDMSYWNWYGFPADYTLAALIDQIVGWGVAGMVLAAVVKQPAA